MSASPKHMGTATDDDRGTHRVGPTSVHGKYSALPKGGVLRTLAVALVAVILSLLGCAATSAIGGTNSSGGWFNRFWFAFFWACLFIPGFMFVNRARLKDGPEGIYLVIALCMTVLFAWSMSVRTVGWDIGTHYRNILVFADWQGDIDHSVSDNSIITVSPLAQAEEGLMANVDAQEEALDANADELFESVDHPTNLMWYVTSVEYIPYALVMRACRTLGVSFSRTLFLMRVTGGIFYALVTYLGMRKLRAGKMLYAAIALLPSSVFLASELGYSYWLFSLCLYGFASFVGMMQGKSQATPFALAKMLGSLFVGMLPRVVYFPIIFLCLLIPNERFGSVRFARLFRGAILGAAFLAFGVWLVPRLISGLGGGDTRGGEVNPAAQIQYILSNPLEYAQTFVRFVLPPLRMEGGGADVEGVNLVSGYLSPEASPGLLANYGYLPRTHWIYTAAIWCLLVWTTFTDKDRNHRYGALPGIVAFVLSFGVLVLIVTALYFDFTPVGLAEIHGVQRRYVLPMLFPLLVFFGPGVLGLTGEKPRIRMAAYNAVAMGGMAAILLCSWWASCVSALV